MVTRMNEKKIKISEAKGRPMLQWVGKRPIDYVQSFPAQPVEIFDPTGESKPIDNPNFDNLKDNWQNLIFHGDNKEVLGYLLANGFRNKIDLIYIDPPFNTGVDYIRKVQLKGIKLEKLDGEYYTSQEQTMYFNNFADDSFLQFMYERLILLKELLSEKGSIFVRFDYHYGHYIKILLDEVFGKNNFRNEIAVNRSTNLGSTKNQFATAYETIYFYSKSNDNLFNKIVTDRICKYCKQEKEPDWVPLEAPGDSKNIEISINGKVFISRRNSHWTFSQEVINKLIAEGKIRINEKRTYLDRFGKRVNLPEYYQFPHQTVNSNWTDIPGYTVDSTGYPTENSEDILERVIKSSTNFDGLVLDCFMGSGTTQAIAQKLNRRWIGVDINKGSIQTVSKRLQKIIKTQKEVTKQKKIVSKTNEHLAFAYYKVNDYDLQLLRTEAVELAIQHIGIQRTKTDNFFEGTIGKNLVKMIDFNHPLTLLDLQLIQDELKSRPDENRNVTIVCLGKELSVDSYIEDYNKKHPINKLELIELRTDGKYGKFLIHKKAQAKINIKRKGDKIFIEINDFISPTIIERLNNSNKLIKVKIPDFRSMIDVVLIDTNYDGKVFNIKYSDVPEKKNDLIVGTYEFNIKNKTTIAVKIIDMLGEEVLIIKEI